MPCTFLKAPSGCSCREPWSHVTLRSTREGRVHFRGWKWHLEGLALGVIAERREVEKDLEDARGKQEKVSDQSGVPRG